jgi:hypothetical protein
MGQLVVDEPRFDGVHWGYCNATHEIMPPLLKTRSFKRTRNNCLGSASAKSTEQRLSSRQLALTVLQVVPHSFKRKKSSCNLRHRKVQQRRQATV